MSEHETEHDDDAPDVRELERTIRTLTDRLERLEAEFRATRGREPESARPPVFRPERAREPEPRPIEPTRAKPRPSAPSSEPAARELETRPSGLHLPPVDRDRLPILLLSVAGGGAVLLGALYFVWYSIQRGLISPEVRVVSAAVLGLVGLASAWPLARRGHRSVAGALGGAGLGAWFGAILVARHVHAFLESGSTFGLLVVGAALGLAVAATCELRFLAFLAALGAVATPLSVGASSNEPHELMGYQLVVVALLWVLEDRRRWPELGHFASLSTWVLLFAWTTERATAEHFASVAAWSLAVLVLGHAQAVLLLRRGRLAPVHAAPRLWIHGYLAWVALGATPATFEEVGWVVLGMALVNAAFGALVWRSVRADRVRTGSPAVRGALVSACASVAWLQLFAFPASQFEMPGIVVWWTVMAVAATALHLARTTWRTALPVVLPLGAGYLASLTLDSPGYQALGFGLALLPAAVGLAPTRERLERPGATALSTWCALLLLSSALAFAGAADRHLDHLLPTNMGVHVTGLALALVYVLRTVRQPARERVAAVVAVLSIDLLALCGEAVDAGLFRSVDGFGPEHVWVVACALAQAALLGLLVAALRGDDKAGWRPLLHDTAGLVRTAAVLFGALVLVPPTVALVAHRLDGTISLTQAGWSVCLAVAGLAQLLQGLLRRRAAWRRAGIALLFLTGAKVVAIDLTEVSMAWRVLSLVALGACMLLGAYAYRRLSSTLGSKPA